MAKLPLGCLILHGFTSSLDCVNGLVPYVEKHHIPYRMPVLRGHGTKPEDLIGVRWHDWYTDGEAALRNLLTEVDKAVVVGLSMGGLVTLRLAMEHGADIAAIALVAAALRVNSPLAPGGPLYWLAPVIAKLIKFRDMSPNYADKELEQYDTNYDKAPMDAIISFLEFSVEVEKRLAEVHTPALIIHSHNDTTIKPISAQIIHDRISSADKKIVWFERTEHEMMRDLERDAVFETIEQYVLEIISTKTHESTRSF